VPVGDGAADGLPTGVVAWASSYALLGAAGVYKPIWEYPRETLWQDLSAHLLYGASTAVASRVVAAGPKSS
jgi:hypothetical protein